MNRLRSRQRPYSKKTPHPSAQSFKGFTLIELLVAIILAALVITPLLGFMVNILGAERREQAKATTEQELRSAVDYIAQDLAQAVYIYDETALTQDSNLTSPADSGIRNQIPPVAGSVGGCTSTATCTPVLAFWKREQLPNKIKFDNTEGCEDTDPDEECNDAFVYTLVVYYRTTDNPNDIWSDQSRIVRFRVRDGIRNPNSDPADPEYFQEPDSGFSLFDLNRSGTLQEKMNTWVKGTGAYNVSAPTLVDYVDSASGFTASVTPETYTAEFFIRGNALERIQQEATCGTTNTEFCPTVRATVQGRGLVGGE